MIAAIALGSNLRSVWGEPVDALREAIRRLGDIGQVVAVSAFRETEPVGLREQPRFTNAALLLETDVPPLPLMRALLALEVSLGRVRSADLPPKGPRVIDLDLLLYGVSDESVVLNSTELTLPHPAMHERLFVLEPLAEIAPELRHPLMDQNVRQLLHELQALEKASSQRLP